MRVAVLGAGGAASNGFLRALQRAGGYDLVGCNANPHDLLLAPCEERHLIPLAGDPGYVQAILELEPDFVHAQNDREVAALSAARDELPVLLPSPKTVWTCQDKWLTFQALEQAGVPSPRSTFLADTAVIGTAVERVGPTVWLRKTRGAGGAGSLCTSSPYHADAWIDLNGGREACWMLAEALTSHTVTVQQLWYAGDLVVSQQRTRRTWANGRNTQTGVSGSTGVGETTNRKDANRVATAAVKAVDAEPNGLYGVDMVLDYEGKPRVTEINPGRFFTTAPEFYAAAGFNMAALYTDIGCREAGDAYVPRVYDPLPAGMLWIRGMDLEPVLATRAMLDNLSRPYVEAA